MVNYTESDSDDVSMSNLTLTVLDRSEWCSCIFILIPLVLSVTTALQDNVKIWHKELDEMNVIVHCSFTFG